jgi:NAD(P)H-dependent FMN reductase
MALPRLSVVVVSTRPGRVGPAIGAWFVERARSHGAFEVSPVDLAEVNLPFLDEAKHPRFKQYEKETTRRWSASVEASDAFVFVTPEYDYSMPATLLNAFQALFLEWNYKACAFVSYGAASGGVRSAQMARQVAATLRMVPLPEAVSIPYVTKELKDGIYPGAKSQEDAAKLVLDELGKWTGALQVLRRPS